MSEVATALRVPGPPDWHVAWDELDRDFAWIRALRDCPQDPVHHAEGDVWIHTRMVCEAMVASPEYRAADPELRTRLFAAALLHDVAKPRCTVVEDDGRIRSPGHSPGGAFDARVILWRLGLGPRAREPVCAMIRYHQVPYHWASRSRSESLVIRMSQTTSLQQLVWLAQADLRGRVCEDQAAKLEDAGLLAEYARELGCLHEPWAFASDHSRAMYFRRSDRDPAWPAHDDSRLTVTVTSGLPGSGKSRWVAAHAGDQPVIELDAIRRELKIDPSEPQGKVLEVARERARELLRRAQPFVWDATNLSRSLRGSLLDLLYGYGARVRLVYVEAPAAVQAERNRARTHAVPQAVVDKLLRRWEPPDLTEAHEVLVVDGDA